MDKSVPRVTVWHHKALPSDALPDSDPSNRFVYACLTLMIDSFHIFVPTLELITILP